MPKRPWLTRDLWHIAGSAFFADLGYQAVLAGFPLFLVLSLHAPVWVFGLAMALAYGPGSLIAWWGGQVGDKKGHRPVAIGGNAFIPLLSLSGLAGTPVEAVLLLAGGWWARNFRTPSRRVLLVRRVPDENDRQQAFGFLHGLDVGGGMLAGIGVLVLLLLHWTLGHIFLLTLLPLAISTLLLVTLSIQPGDRAPDPAVHEDRQAETPAAHERSRSAILWAATLYGFSSYNLGFPILTVAEGTRSSLLGVLSYIVFLGISALTGFLFGRQAKGTLKELGNLGYGGAAVGSLGLAVAYGLHAGVLGLLLPVAVLGWALGVIEILEPSLISRFGPAREAGRGMGALTGARSIGLFGANLIMGLLYHLTPVGAYVYAAVMALGAVVVLSVLARPVRTGG